MCMYIDSNNLLGKREDVLLLRYYFSPTSLPVFTFSHMRSLHIFFNIYVDSYRYI